MPVRYNVTPASADSLASCTSSSPPATSTKLTPLAISRMCRRGGFASRSAWSSSRTCSTAPKNSEPSTRKSASCGHCGRGTGLLPAAALNRRLDDSGSGVTAVRLGCVVRLR